MLPTVALFAITASGSSTNRRASTLPSPVGPLNAGNLPDRTVSTAGPADRIFSPLLLGTGIMSLHRIEEVIWQQAGHRKVKQYFNYRSSAPRPQAIP
ncbi:hypothetical protein [Nocardia yamanashiensis]|uniref:hypothetical protein n=1 Tax=Nocardia yamanashiensis TaxID=209247 RepID=UPI000836FA93|nr:hypothetical protein [Nocardia yamanashiensis]